MKAPLPILVAVVLVTGCASAPPEHTGFLSDYSRLDTAVDDGVMYLDPNGRLADYERFIIEPVVVMGGGDDLQAGELRAYTHSAFSRALTEDERFRVTVQPGPGVARIRIALTEASISRPGLRLFKPAGAALEAEVLDSKTGEQIAAAVLAQSGSRISLDGLTTWGDAMAVIDDWARRFRERLDEAHGE
ncbi:MAG: DUF3313 domain-containing protein [Planctomycetota bacterium]|nr:DUF3313 domain-containing protein [Planctomycetota bacterium]